MSKDNGGPAFPDMRRLDLLRSVQLGSHEKETIYSESSGMSLRDYFAAKAMQAYVSTYPCQALDSSVGGIEIDMLALAEDAYDLADAMLETRKQ